MQKKGQKIDLDVVLNGKMPPHDTEMEKMVLGTLLMNNHAASEVMDILTPEMFYDYKHQLIFRAMQNLYAKSVIIDLMTVAGELKREDHIKEVGGTAYVAELMSRLASTANALAYCKLLADKLIRRNIIKGSTQIIIEAYEGNNDIDEIIEQGANLYDNAQTKLGGDTNIITIAEAISQADKNIELIRKRGLTGLTTGFAELDAIIFGWQPGDLVILAARPSMGKTALALNFLRNAAVLGKTPVGVISLEMPSIQLTERLQAAEAGIDLELFKKGTLTDPQITAKNIAIANLASAPIYIDDTPSINISQLKARVKHLVHKHKIKLLVIDYLQLLSGSTKGNREQEIAEISRGLKLLAKSLGITILALSQLSRAVETRGGNKKPMLSDLRESGSIEQDADIVCFLYRPKYYGIETNDEGVPVTSGYTELIISKHRNGALATINLNLEYSIQKFTEYQSYSQPSPQPFSPPPTQNTMQPNTNFYEPNTDENPF